MRGRIFIAALMLIATSMTCERAAFAQGATQSESQQPPARNASSITGRVVNESGQPLPNARVFVNGFGRQAARRTVNTDEAGRFVVDGLPRGTYIISVQASGYVLTRDQRDSIYNRPGDSVTLVVKKGAVITGRVTTSDGEPVVGVQVSGILVRDSEGRLAGGSGPSRYTDDRGVYRLFGLTAGTYVVAAGSRPFGGPTINAYSDDAPTYYPSSTRDTASQVVIQYGAEATGIDIRYRGERGHAISGSIVEASVEDPTAASVNVLLMRASNDGMEAQAFIQPRGNERPFAIYGVTDGDYYLTARRGAYQSDDGAASKRVPVKVRGRDVTGITISLSPLGSIAGRFTLDAATRSARCETKQPPAIEETLISFSTDESDNSDPSSRFSSALLAPGSEGDFVFQGLPAARYRLDGRRMLDEAWYVRAITAPGPTNTQVDASRAGLTVRPGQRISGVRVVLGEGAASIRGRVISDKEGASLPDRLRVYLVPAEPDSAGDVLRYFEGEVQSDGSFKPMNLAPGRYWLLARQLSDQDAKQRITRPLVWNDTSRISLRRDAEASNIAIDLKPCQRVADYQLRYNAPKESQTRKQ